MSSASVPHDDPTRRRTGADLRRRLPAVLRQGLPGDVDRGHRRRGRRRPTDDLHCRRTEGDHPAPRRRSSPRRRRRTGPDRPATLVARGHRRTRPRAFDRTARPQHVPDQPARRRRCYAPSRPQRPSTPKPARSGSASSSNAVRASTSSPSRLTAQDDPRPLRREHHHRHPVHARSRRLPPARPRRRLADGPLPGLAHRRPPPPLPRLITWAHRRHGDRLDRGTPTASPSTGLDGRREGCDRRRRGP